MYWLLKEKAVVIFNLVSQFSSRCTSFFKWVFPWGFIHCVCTYQNVRLFKGGELFGFEFCFSLEHIVLLRILYKINNSKLWLTFWEEKLVYSSRPTLQSRTSFVIFSFYFFRPQVCLAIKNYISYNLLFWSILAFWNYVEHLEGFFIIILFIVTVYVLCKIMYSSVYIHGYN